jgi:hypothetical protein
VVRPSGGTVIDLNLSDTSGGLARYGPGQRGFHCSVLPAAVLNDGLTRLYYPGRGRDPGTSD